MIIQLDFGKFMTVYNRTTLLDYNGGHFSVRIIYVYVEWNVMVGVYNKDIHCQESLHSYRGSAKCGMVYHGFGGN